MHPNDVPKRALSPNSSHQSRQSGTRGCIRYEDLLIVLCLARCFTLKLAPRGCLDSRQLRTQEITLSIQRKMFSSSDFCMLPYTSGHRQCAVGVRRMTPGSAVRVNHPSVQACMRQNPHNVCFAGCFRQTITKPAEVPSTTAMLAD